MNPFDYLQILGPMQDQFTRIYSAMSGIIAIVLVLWLLNLLVGFVQRTYATGKIIGGFYRNYLHRYLKLIFSKLFSSVRKEISESNVNINVN